MTTTTDHEITEDAWTQVAEGATSVFLQLKTNGPVMVAIDADEPATGTEGVVMSRGGIDALSFDGFTGNVYLRGRDNDTELVTVIAS
jgi:hypothetical protein